jgi:ABC-type sulfate transport system permease component
MVDEDREDHVVMSGQVMFSELVSQIVSAAFDSGLGYATAQALSVWMGVAGWGWPILVRVVQS